MFFIVGASKFNVAERIATQSICTRCVGLMGSCVSSDTLSWLMHGISIGVQSVKAVSENLIKSLPYS